MFRMFFRGFCIFQRKFRLIFFPEVVQMQTLGEVKNWKAI